MIFDFSSTTLIIFITLKTKTMNKQTIHAEIKAYLIDKLNDYKGGNYYACDLASILTEGEKLNKLALDKLAKSRKQG